ncbi:MAG: hypothetical protein HRT44_02050 [Bdellovibrionales bacterium]|nr:hypothetical protein [Bdellovibrionales bacterium]
MFLLFGTEPQPLTSMLIQVSIQLFCLGLFWRTSTFIKSKNFSLAYHKNSSASLVTDGPFSYIRNPFYTSYLLCYCAMSIYLANPLLYLNLLALITIYVNAVRSEELSLSESSFKNEYQEYLKNTKRFIPFIL